MTRRCRVPSSSADSIPPARMPDSRKRTVAIGGGLWENPSHPPTCLGSARRRSSAGTFRRLVFSYSRSTMTFYAAIFDGRKRRYRVRKYTLRVKDHEPVWPGPIALMPRLYPRLKDCLDFIRERTESLKPDALPLDGHGAHASDLDTRSTAALTPAACGTNAGSTDTEQPAGARRRRRLSRLSEAD